MLDAVAKTRLRCRMVLMIRPEKRGKNVEVEQSRFHGHSSSKRFTKSVETVGDLPDSRTTANPFFLSVTSGRSAPCRTSSLTAFPKLMP
jgi:hypothetical protein